MAKLSRTRSAGLLPRWLGRPLSWIARLLYNVSTSGLENLPESGGVLLVANHMSYVDGVVLQLACPRPVRFVGDDDYRRSHWFARRIFRLTGTIPLGPRSTLSGTRRILAALQAGEVVCMFPEGGISRTGQLMDLRPGYDWLAHRAGVPVLPVGHDGLWGSVFSFAGKKYLWKSPRLMPTSVFVAFGQPIPPEKLDATNVRQALLDLIQQACEWRPLLRRNLAREAVRALAKRPWRVEIVDRTSDRREVRAGQLLAVAAALSRHIRKTIPDRRVGIVLPPGAGATIANLAVACAGKIPVNLNFTVGRAAQEACLRIGEVRTVISAEILKTKFSDFPWPADTRDMTSLVAAAGGKPAIIRWLVAVWLLPNQWLPALLGLPKVGDREEVSLLFTSGSSGEPKGVPLTHRNILANCSQISSLAILPDSATLIACLPVFHSFGCTVTLWYPMLRGCRVVTVPSPLDSRKIIDAIRDERASVMISTPTFMRPFLKKAEPAELKTMELLVTGSEKLPMELYEAFRERFNIEIMQGYGITEASPVTNINQPNPPIVTRSAKVQVGKSTGSVGRLLPGLSARIVHPETGEVLPLTSTGILCLRGSNIFGQYLRDEEKTKAAFLPGGWFYTGDLARFDSAGFLYIEGRLSRFSKIGGEMVPHGTVEQCLNDAFAWDLSEAPKLAVVGVPDATKGEQLVVLTTEQITPADVRERLLAAGLPALWVPKVVCHVAHIPVLGSGKLDLRACKLLAIGVADSCLCYGRVNPSVQ